MSITRLSDLRDASGLVLKVGSALVVESGRPRVEWLAGFAAEVAALRRAGQRVVIVSSGAIALGAARLGLPGGGRASLADAQAAASVGQVMLAQLWAQAFAAHDVTAAQLLVTLGDFENRRSYLNAAATLDRLLELGSVPVVNENDSVATEEIRFGDNDRLAARVAQAAGAAGVLLLSDVDGLFDRDPAQPGARLIARVDRVDAEVEAMASGASGSGLGSGGMRAKLAAARIAARAGIALVVANGRVIAPLERALREEVGTLFLAGPGPAARKGWLGGRLAPAGTLRVDGGCARALGEGASLLAPGIVAVEGDFQRGDLVRVVDADAHAHAHAHADGVALAQGLVEYDAAQVRAIMGLRADAQAAALGFAPRAAVIHRDHLARL